jgi:nitric oxide reductase NorQ protein
MMVMSYNPGYQSIVKDLKQSTRQRFASMVFGNPPQEVERRIIESETGLDRESSERLAEMAVKIRELKGFGLEEGVSTRLLVYSGRLLKSGLDACAACRHAIGQTLADDAEVMESIDAIVKLYFGDIRKVPADEGRSV